MMSLGEWCVVGNPELGFEKDFKMALKMFETLHVSGDPEGTAHLGKMFYRGQGTTQNVQKGLVYMGIARGKSSSLGAYFLAECLPTLKLACQLMSQRHVFATNCLCD